MKDSDFNWPEFFYYGIPAVIFWWLSDWVLLIEFYETVVWVIKRIGEGDLGVIFFTVGFLIYCWENRETPEAIWAILLGLFVLFLFAVVFETCTGNRPRYGDAFPLGEVFYLRCPGGAST